MNSPLFRIAERLLSDSISLMELKSVLTEYKSLLLDATSLELGLSSNRKNISLDKGIAIGLDWAVSCLDDPIRTHKFIRGTKQAIDQKLHEKNAPVHLLYAGTGPFATLIFPLLSYFSSDQLVVTLLDINPQSVDNLSKLVARFGFEDSVDEIRCADATKTVFENASSFDILLSETMQHALEKEAQVLITSHLLNQMHDAAIVIPQSIDLDLVKIISFESEIPPKRLGELMKVDNGFLRTENPFDSDWSVHKVIELPDFNKETDGYLAISTMINVFQNEKIEWGESGLTTHKIVGLVTEFFGEKSVSIKYVVDPIPTFKVCERIDSIV